MSLNPDQHCAEGERLLREGDLDGAFAELHEAVKEQPRAARAQRLLGICHAQRGDLAASIAALQAAAEAQPGDAATEYNLGVALAKAGRREEARAALQRALEADPGYERARQALAVLEPERGPAAAAGPAPHPPAYGSVESPGAESAPAAAGWLAEGGAPAGAPQPDGGLVYTAPQLAEEKLFAPSLGKRLGRGLLWGPLIAQVWTLLTLFWGLVWGGFRGDDLGIAGIIVVLIVYGFLYAFFGGLAGLLTALFNTDSGGGAMIGIGAGMTVMLLEVLLSGDAFMFVNVIFYFFTGSLIGSAIANKVQQPVSG